MAYRIKYVHGEGYYAQCKEGEHWSTIADMQPAKDLETAVALCKVHNYYNTVIHYDLKEAKDD